MFDLSGKVVVITGGAGFLGKQHAEAVAEFNGIPIILDLDKNKCENLAKNISDQYNVKSLGFNVDITSEKRVSEVCKDIKNIFGKIDVLINNAANDPKVSIDSAGKNFSRLEYFDIDQWNSDLNVGLTGAFICSKYIGKEISKNKEGGAIINISSDLGLISPDQRLYIKHDKLENEQSVKPVTYSVVKSGLIGLTRYLSTYWADKNVRCNAICPGGVYNNQDDEFLKRLNKLIPLGRMAKSGEYKGIIIFLSSDASSYMNGAIISIDGGRTVW
tara:strand:- start:107 stop:925 length:819 start_codon:yes stop_codon:yes gene_type:complete